MKKLIIELRTQGAPEKRDPKQAISEFLQENPNPEDEQIHELADQLGIDKHEFEEIAYGMLAEMLRPKKGTAKEMDPHQLEMGEEVEKEHTDNPEVARKIAIDHLSEPGQQNYYTKLKKMEKKK